VPEYVALIAGVTGAIGSAISRELVAYPDWKVLGISRHAPLQPVKGVNYLQLDLSDSVECRKQSRTLSDVTHVFYCGRVTHAEQVIENVDENLGLLSNLIESVEMSAPNLSHVHLVQGGKYYGVHIGPFPTPAREEAQRASIENFNYDQQDFLVERSRNADWSWSASRPNTLLHYSPGNARNLVSTLGAYAALRRETGAALDFPGNQGAFDSLTQVTSLELLARGIHWMSINPACVNQAFNLTNSDVFRWRDIWPALANAFEMPLGSVQPLSLDSALGGCEHDWQGICQKHGLREPDLNQVANWSYADATLARHWDEILCHNKVRHHGFLDWDDSREKFLKVLQQYRETRILPE